VAQVAPRQLAALRRGSLADAIRSGAVIVATEISEALTEARQRTLDLVAPFSDEQVEGSHSPLMSPLAWDLAHIAAYEDLWLVHRHGGEPLLHPELAAMYDAFETPRAVRADLPILNRAEALCYLADVRDRALAILERAGAGEVHEMVLQHEQQHNETMLQAIELAHLPTAPGLVPAPRRPAAGGHNGLEAIEIPAGTFEMGAPPASPSGSSPASPRRFSYDNERPRHGVDLPAFRIGRTAITNATFLRFVEGGGYQRREWWSDEGWAWKEEYDITHPHGWAAGPAGWRQWRIDGDAPLHPEEPVVHLSWFEADAFARAHGARLPTEAEWEKAATWNQQRRFPQSPNLDQTGLGPHPVGGGPSGTPQGMLGDTWEWTASEFRGYPGFVAHPYREYSEVFFGKGYYVLRGGSWATRARVATPTFRNWDLPQRRQIFSGVRLAWDV
jgi:gamma-glutamyl hercynylcysteine S-oxide synthase